MALSAGIARRVLLVNHGYPPLYNAGSEVYTQTLALGLRRRGLDTAVFTREENHIKPDFVVTRSHDHIDPSVSVFKVNYARENPYARFENARVEEKFAEIVEDFNPDVIHVNHFNHLSLGLLRSSPVVTRLPSVLTLHDYWHMCPRGQFVHVGLSEDRDVFPMCTGQEDLKCARRCYNRFRGGSDSDADEDAYWARFVNRFMTASRRACNDIDVFLAPSPHLASRFVNEFGLDAGCVHVVNYGFDRDRLAGRRRGPLDPSKPVVFGFAGRHIPVKGIHQLIEAFAGVQASTDVGGHHLLPRLIVWGRNNGQYTDQLHALVADADESVQTRVEFRPEYANENIVRDVFDHCDAMVVPSIWEENSPLIIHEAAHARMPVITADYGGMADYVADGRNGLTYPFRSVNGLRDALQRMVDDPSGAVRSPGYLHSDDGQVPSIEEHVDAVVGHYDTLLEHYHNAHRGSGGNLDAAKRAGRACSALSTARFAHTSAAHALEHRVVPWRITFDTNPDDCNFSCVMCEEHSGHSNKQVQRKKEGKRRRRMDPKLIRSVVEELAPHGLREIIPTTMGEPLMHWKIMDEIISVCKEHDVRLNLTTNGSFPNRGAEQWAELIVPVASDVKISWNGATEGMQEKIMKGSHWATQTNNLKTFLRVRDDHRRHGRIAADACTVTLQATFMEENVHELPMLVKMAAALGIERVKGHHLWAHFDEIKDQDMRRSQDSRVRWNEVARECRRVADEDRLSTGAAVRLDNFEDLEVDDAKAAKRRGMAIDSVCPFLGQEAWLHYNGRFDPCCAPDDQRKALGSFGNITEHDNKLMPLWNSEEYKSLVREYTAHPLCRACNMRRPVSS